jgi:DNA polymerase-1
VKHHHPKLIVCLGVTAAKAVLKSNSLNLKGIRGRVFEIELDMDRRTRKHAKVRQKIQVVATYHPAMVLRNPAMYPTVLEDFRWFQRVLAGSAKKKEDPADRVYQLDGTIGPELSKLITTMSVDVETTTFSPWEKGGKLLCCAVSASPLTATAFPLGIRHINRGLISKLKNKKVEKVGHNLKFDLLWLHRFGFEVNGPLFDTMVAFHLLAEDYPDLSLEHLAAKYTPMGYYAGGMKEKRGSFTEVTDEILEYCAMDADATLRLRHLFTAQIRKQGLRKTFRLLMRTLRTLTEVEEGGMHVDRDVLDSISNELQDQRTELREAIRELAPEVNLGSPRQVSQFLFEKMGLKPVVFTEKHFPSTNELALSKLLKKQKKGTDAHAFLSQLLRFRGMMKTETAFLTPLRNEHLRRDGMVHPQYHMARTVTGRLSCSAPNLQQVPEEVKPVFTSRFPDGSIVQADFSQIELRILAHLSQEPVMMSVFDGGGDIHTATAERLYQKAAGQITAEERDIAKRVNFGILYGMAAGRLTAVAGIEFTEAQRFLERFWSAYPAVRKWVRTIRRQCIVEGEVRGLLGRKRRIPILDPESKEAQHQLRQAVNYPVQWGATVVTFVALNRIRAALKHMVSKIVTTVHDSIVLDCPKDEVLEVVEILQTICEKPGLEAYGVDLTVPLRATVKIGPNWGDLKEV